MIAFPLLSETMLSVIVRLEEEAVIPSVLLTIVLALIADETEVNIIPLPLLFLMVLPASRTELELK